MSWNELSKTGEVWAELLATGEWFTEGWFTTGWFLDTNKIVVSWTELTKNEEEWIEI